MLERGGAGAEPSGLRSIPEDKAFLQSPRHSGEARHASLRHALQNSLVRSALKNTALICTWCGLTRALAHLCCSALVSYSLGRALSASQVCC